MAREAGARLAGEDGSAFPEELDAPVRALLVARDDAVLGDLCFALAVA